ncbi:hypothetical protein LSS_07209 [Leptospira santarosai serovar Shermani str. LT 821]|uniref:Uncharacterized protein n=3 Tax=Leptospira santarosai TaxID=28183 RepID=K8YA53_9LEPT|nr:hypothetical protein LSS_07209 [Leptospira santarosai serovar Shermani str. LT 821]
MPRFSYVKLTLILRMLSFGFYRVPLRNSNGIKIFSDRTRAKLL